MAHLDLAVSAHASLQKQFNTLSLSEHLLCTALQITSLMLTFIQVWVLAGPLRNFNLYLEKPYVH